MGLIRADKSRCRQSDFQGDLEFLRRSRKLVVLGGPVAKSPLTILKVVGSNPGLEMDVSSGVKTSAQLPKVEYWIS